MALIPVMLFSALLHAFVGWRLLGDLALTSPALAWATGLVLLASALLMPMGLFARRAAGVTRKNMAATLDRIEELLASP